MTKDILKQKWTRTALEEVIGQAQCNRETRASGSAYGMAGEMECLGYIRKSFCLWKDEQPSIRIL